MGYTSTLDYVAAAAATVLHTTGLLPHINAGVMSAADLRALRAVSISQGLMLESLSTDLLRSPQGAHFECPDKEPALRLSVLEAAGEQCIPFTTGILVGIGETRADRIEALLAIKESHARHGHIQEVIIQNFRAKKGTLMAMAEEPSLDELLWTVAAARLILGSSMNIQAPPNLTPESDDVSKFDEDDDDDDDSGKKDKNNNTFSSSKQGNTTGSLTVPKSDENKQQQHQKKAATAGGGGTNDYETSWIRLIDAGINDWGGVSPLTRDFVNPERPWPHVLQLAAATAAAGKVLVPRLPVYPSHLNEKWLDGGRGAGSPLAAALRNADVHGLARCSPWVAGAVDTDVEKENKKEEEDKMERKKEKLQLKRAATPHPRLQEPSSSSSSSSSLKIILGADGLLAGSHASSQNASQAVQSILSSLSSHQNCTAEDIEVLFSARGADYMAITRAADALRHHVNGDTVTYVVNRNINYTNICTYGCKFCAFSKGPASEELRGSPYLLSFEEIRDRTAEAWRRGATEVCLQGGIHPDFTGETYLKILSAAKTGAPDIHVHAFSPLEIVHGASTLNWSLSRYLSALRDAGLGSLPGTAAEVLDDAVRAVLCPDKLNSQEWLQVVETAHSVGLKTTSTIMFGHVDSVASWARHLLSLREVARRSGGVSEFVPLPFVHMEAPIYRKGKARAGPTFRECVLMHSVARLVLHPYITNIQASWVKMGPERAAELLSSGCNDMGGVLMNESITRAAGAEHGQELGAEEMEALIRAAGKVPVQRTTLYGRASEERRATSLCAAPLVMY